MRLLRSSRKAEFARNDVIARTLSAVEEDEAISIIREVEIATACSRRRVALAKRGRSPRNDNLQIQC